MSHVTDANAGKNQEGMKTVAVVVAFLVASVSFTVSSTLATSPSIQRSADALSWALDVDATDDENRIENESKPPSPRLFNSTWLLVGVKSAAFGGVEARQTFRQTWVNDTTRPRDVAVLFLVGEPSETNATLQAALNKEKQTYGDLLTHELACKDSYWTLVDKVKGFFQWIEAQSTLATLEYVLISDDDVAIHLHGLVVLLQSPTISRRRFYGGQVIQAQFGIPIVPLRDPTERNYLPVHEYSMHEKPFFATGAHYVLSVDLVQFLGRNTRHLRGIGTLEDVSVAFWLLSLLGISPVHLPQFGNVRYTLCHNAFLAYADLSLAAIRRIHENLRHHRPFCDGFSFLSWDKRSRDRPTDLPQSWLTGKRRMHRELRQKWDVYVDERSRELFLITTINADDVDETTSLVYAPAKDSLTAFCHELLKTAAITMPTTVIPRDFCLTHQGYLTEYLSSLVLSTPAISPVFALARENIHEDSTSPAIFVQLLPNAATSRTLVECLLAGTFPGAYIAVLAVAEYQERFHRIAPDMIISSTSESVDFDSTRTLHPRVIVFRDLETVIRHDKARSPNLPVIYVTPILNDPVCQHANCVYLPIAAQSFARQQEYSPVVLLEPTKVSPMFDREMILLPCRHRHVVAASATDVLTRALEEEGLIVHHEECGLTADIERLTKFQFVIVVEDRIHVSGHISDQMISAFLAGTIPIYYGHSSTATWLFNANAFVDCGSFRSLRDCARHIRHITVSPHYQAMKNEPPIVSLTAFVEVFSWHPHVIERTPRDLEHCLIHHRLRTLIHNNGSSAI